MPQSRQSQRRSEVKKSTSSSRLSLSSILKQLVRKDNEIEKLQSELRCIKGERVALLRRLAVAERSLTARVGQNNATTCGVPATLCPEAEVFTPIVGVKAVDPVAAGAVLDGIINQTRGNESLAASRWKDEEALEVDIENQMDTDYRQWMDENSLQLQ